MAARVIILTFKDEKAAEQFARLKTQWEEEDFEAPPGTEGEVLALGAIVAAQTKLEAIVAKPSNPCTCTSSKHVNRGGGYTKTKKFGWWVHAACAKPEMRVIQDFIKNMILSSGNDLLPAMRDKFKAQREPTPVPITVDTPVYNAEGSLVRVDQTLPNEVADAPADAQGEATQDNEARLRE